MDVAFGGAGRGGAGAGGRRPCGASPCFLLLYGSCPAGSWVPLGGEMVLKFTFTLCNPPRVISCPRSPAGHVQTPFPSDKPTTSGRCLWVWLSWAWLEEGPGCGCLVGIESSPQPEGTQGPRSQSGLEGRKRPTCRADGRGRVGEAERALSSGTGASAGAHSSSGPSPAPRAPSGRVVSAERLVPQRGFSVSS